MKYKFSEKEDEKIKAVRRKNWDKQIDKRLEGLNMRCVYSKIYGCFSFILCFILFTGLTGCSPKEDLPKEKTGLLAGDELTLYLDLIGKTAEEVMEGLSLTDEQIVDTGSRGMDWSVSETREIEGEAFTQKLLFETPDQPQVLYGYQYALAPDPLYDEEKIRDLAAAIALKATEYYGNPITYPDASNRIFDDDGNLTDMQISFNAEGNRITNWDVREVWNLSEDEALVMKVSVSAEWQYIWLDYRTKNGLHLEYLEHMKNDG